jgi:hypothetical protein
VPLNANGFSPGFIPAVGYQLTQQVAVQFTVLGTAGFMLNLVVDVESSREVVRTARVGSAADVGAATGQ